MTPLQLEPSAHAPWMRTMFGRAFISGSLRGRVLRPSCGARPRPGYPQHYCTLRMPVARPACTPCLGWVRPFRGANPGSQLVAVVTAVPGFGVADVRACRSGNELTRLIKGLVSGAFVCCG